MLLNFSHWKQHRSLDLRGTKAFRTSPKNLPGEYPGTLGEDCCCCPWTKQKGLHEEVQGKIKRSSVFIQKSEFEKNVTQERQNMHLIWFCLTGTGGDG